MRNVLFLVGFPVLSSIPVPLTLYKGSINKEEGWSWKHCLSGSKCGEEMESVNSENACLYI